MVAREKPSDDVVETASGLIVPKSAIAVSGKSVDQAVQDALRRKVTAYDPDGRRRVGLTASEERAIQKAVDVLSRNGIGVLLGCIGRFDAKDPCGGFLTPEGSKDCDGGFGCSCTRIHFLRV